MPDLKDSIKAIIAARLVKARDCEFKKAWIPEGWTAVKDDVFVEELAGELANWVGSFDYDKQVAQAAIERADEVMHKLEETLNNWKPEAGDCKPESLQ